MRKIRLLLSIQADYESHPPKKKLPLAKQGGVHERMKKVTIGGSCFPIRAPS